MSRILLFLLCATLSLQTIAQQNSNRLTDSEQVTIKQFIADFFEAVKNKDRQTIERALDTDFVLISSDSNGEQIKKESYINGVMAPDFLKVSSCQLSDFTFTRQGNVIVANFRIQWESQYKGKPWNANFINTDIIIRTKDGFKVIYRHTSYPASQLKRIVEERYSGR